MTTSRPSTTWVIRLGSVSKPANGGPRMIPSRHIRQITGLADSHASTATARTPTRRECSALTALAIRLARETQTTINGVTMTRVFGIANPGHDILPGDPTHISTGPVYLSGSWLLVKDPDRETAGANTTVASGITGDPDITVTAGAEISDAITAGLNEFDTTTPYPVNKIATDWNSPIGAASTSDTSIGYNQRNMSASARVWNVSEFCTDCHDGNAGLHTIQAPLFSEDRALRDQGHSTDTPEWKGNYDLAYGHDAQPRH